ncbi:MAG TPA: hypothetical protein VEO20_07025 [Thermoplasmata archaeon]|nr:hypothetical protein [Thermoplasmata archaeon]
MVNPRRRSGRRDPNALDVLALAEAKRALNRHRESLDGARRARDGTIERARDSLRTYKSPLVEAVDGRRKGLEFEMKAVDRFDAPLKAAKAQTRRRHSAGPSKDI